MKFRPGIFSAIGIAIAALVVGGVIAGTAAWRAWGSVRMDPDVVLRAAWTQALDATSVTTDGVVAATVEVPPRGAVTGLPAPGGMSVRVQYHRAHTRDDTGARSDVASTIAATLPNIGALTATLALRTVGEQQYLRLDASNVVPTGDSPSSLPLLIAGVQGVIGGRWMRIDAAGLEAISTILPAAISIPDRGIAGSGVRDTSQLAAMPLFRNAEDLGADRVDGDRTLHYRAPLNPDVARAYLQSASVSDRSATEQVTTALALTQTQLVSAVEHIVADVWVTRRGHMLRRVSFPFQLSDPTSGATVHGSADFQWRGWNAPVTVEAPTDAVPIANLLGPLLLGRGSGDADSADARDADGDGLGDALEAVYGSDPARPDTDGDGYPDGNEVKNGYSPTGSGRLPPL